jgi:hypothetical protein
MYSTHFFSKKIISPPWVSIIYKNSKRLKNYLSIVTINDLAFFNFLKMSVPDEGYSRTPTVLGPLKYKKVGSL